MSKKKIRKNEVYVVVADSINNGIRNFTRNSEVTKINFPQNFDKLIKLGAIELRDKPHSHETE